MRGHSSDFDAWREKYKNPFKDLGDNRRLRNWDNEMRNGQQDADGIVGEVIFPNTVPPFFPSFVLFAAPPTPDEYEYRLAGVRAHNRWLEDFCGQFPARRAGIGQFFVNDIDDAIEDVKWIKEHNLRGGALLPSVPPDGGDPLSRRLFGRDARDFGRRRHFPDEHQRGQNHPGFDGHREIGKHGERESDQPGPNLQPREFPQLGNFMPLTHVVGNHEQYRGQDA